mmetsp:Transcript_43961/g.141745  ORF Transcript_43961/g.141745 Transcript_43961/m.141745 type:complete len:348 (+) Transcript_43961:41-1084(+)
MSLPCPIPRAAAAILSMLLLLYAAKAQSVADGAPTGLHVIWVAVPGDCILATSGAPSRVSWGHETLEACQVACQDDKRCWATSFTSYSGYPRCSLLTSPPTGATPKQGDASCSVKVTPLSRNAFRGPLRVAAAGAKSAGRCTHALNMQAGDWSRCDFAEFTMSGTDISKSNADFARFSFAVLVGLLGSETSFRGAYFEGAIARRAVFNNADLTDASLIGADLQGASLYDAVLVNAKLDDAKFFNATLTLANLANANAPKASFNGADLTTADLRGASFDGASLKGAVLFEADLTGASFKDADLTGAVWGSVVGFDTADFAGARNAPSLHAVECQQKTKPCAPPVLVYG